MFQFECALLQFNGCVLREEAGRDIFGIRKVCISLLETRAKGKRAEEEAEATDETDSVFLAAWTSARIPSASFSDGLRPGVQARVVEARVLIAVQETLCADKI